MQPIAFQLSGDRDNPSVSVNDKAFCIPASPMSDRGQAVMHPTIIDRAAFNVDKIGSLCARDYKGVGTQYVDEGKTIVELDTQYQVATQTYPTMAIRRLTPTETERLQGFPDFWTKIPYRNKPADQCPDGPRYKACGNSMAVPVMRWIGERIQMVEDLMKTHPTPKNS
jgi:site-specific DNA-cytosine methylase